MTVTNVLTQPPGSGLQAFDGLAKDWYGKLWMDHVNKTVEVLKFLGKVRGRMGGRRVLNAVIDELPQSAGFANQEYHDFMAPSTTSSFQPELIARSLYTILQWTGEVEDAARAGDKAAFAGPRMTDLKRARTQYAINKARMAYLGYYQALGQLSAVAAAPVYTLHPRNDRTSVAASFWKFGTHYLRKNMSIQTSATLAGDPLETTATQERKITAITRGGGSPTITLDGSIAGDNIDDFIHPWGYVGAELPSTVGAADEASFFAGPNGLCNLVLDASLYATVYGEARSSRPTLSGQRVNNLGTAEAYDELMASLLIDIIADDGTGDEPDVFLIHRSTRREVLKDNKGDRRFAPVQTESGHGRLTFIAGDTPIPWHTDRDCPPGMIWALRKGTLGTLMNRPLASIDKAPERFVRNKDARQIVMAERFNTFCSEPLNNGAREDIQFDVGAVI